MSYLQQIAQRNSPPGNQPALLPPQAIHPFAAAGPGTAEGLTEITVFDTPSSDPVTIIHSIQHSNLPPQMPAATTPAEKPVQREQQNQSTYIRSQLERTIVVPSPITGQPRAGSLPETRRHSNHETKETFQLTSHEPAVERIPDLLPPLNANKEPLPSREREAIQQIVPIHPAEQTMPAAKQLMPLAPPHDPSPQIRTAQNKLVIGKITVEILPPIPPVKPRERIITRMVTAPARNNSNSAGRNKLSFGLGQI